MKKIHVLFVGMSSNIGGIEIFLLNLVKNSNPNLFQFDFLYSGDNQIAFEDELKKYNCNIYRIIPRKKNYFRHLKELKKVLLNDYDYVHINIMSYSWFEPIYYSCKYGKKTIIHSHNAGFINDLSLKSKFLNYIGKTIIKSSNCYKVACGNDAGKYMFDSKFEVFNNGIDINKFKFNIRIQSELKKELNLSKNDFIVGNIAKLEKQKNPLFLIKIFNEYIKLNKNAKLVIIGVGSLEKEIINSIKELHLEGKVLLIGQRLDAYKYYSLFDVYLMPSLYEGLSISLVEAQTSGLMCYTSKNVDINSDVTGNVSFISLEDNPRIWAKRIKERENTRDLEAYKKVEKYFELKMCNNRIYNFYIKNLQGDLYEK